MTTPFQQAQTEGLCLRYPENFGLHPNINYDTAVNMLLRAIPLSQQVPYSWGFVDKPPEGQVLLLFLPPQSQFPIDGIRFQDQETKYTMPVGSTRELEVHEVKFGFVPGGQDPVAWRMRRRFRLHKGGHPQLVLVHYTRGPTTQILPSLVNQPVRSYPLRPISEPSVFVMGDKAGQKIFTHGAPPPPQQAMPPAPGMGMPMGMGFNQQAMVAQQNSTMEALERRRERERERERGRDRGGSTTGRPPRPEEEDSGDETEQISTRTLALTRYRRNHDLMNDVFRQAAYGDKHAPSPPAPYSIFNKSELEEKAAKLKEEIDVLNARAAERKAAKSIAEQEFAEHRMDPNDVSMETLGEGILV